MCINYLDFLSEQAKEYKSGSDNTSHRFFKMYKHDEPTDIASKKIEEKLKDVNPHSITVRHDNTSFTMIHPGGELITNVNTVKHMHHVTTQYVSTNPAEYGLAMGDAIRKGELLYESIRTTSIVTGGKPFIRQKNREAVRQGLQKLQQDFFSTHRARHSSTFNMGEENDEVVNEAYRDVYTIQYTHKNKKTGKVINSEMSIEHAVNAKHAEQIAANISGKRKLKDFTISKVLTK